MSEKLEPKASDIVPSSESLTLPSALTPDEQQNIRHELDNVIKEIGIARQLRESTETNLKEFESTLQLTLEKIRSELQPTYIDLISDLTRTVEENHLGFLSSVESGFQELVIEVQKLQGEQTAWEKLKEYQQRLDKEHQERLNRLSETTENTARELLENIRHLQIDSDPGREILVEKVQALAEENGKLKKALANIYRQVQDIGLLSLGKKKNQILEALEVYINA